MIPSFIAANLSHTPSIVTQIDRAKSMRQESITATVNWNMVQGTTTRLGFGLNAFQGFRPASFNSAAYRSNMALIKPGFIRFHNGSALQDSSVPDGLIDRRRRTWDANKVKSALSASVTTFGQDQPQRMINIPTWADWMDADRDGFLDRDQFDNYAQLCADFVKIVNKDARFNVKYWEVMNEKDDQYFTQFYTNGGWGGLKDPAKPDRLKELITIYNKAAVAMKRIDPTIQVGGIGIARPDLQQFYVPFIRGTVEHLDFFTYHFYATGEASTSDSAIFDAPRSLGDHTRSIVQALKAASPNRVIPAMLGEYNISWTWETRDPRMTNSKGVVFDALSLVSALSNGATATLAWNEKDGIYGKTDDQDQLRLGGTFFKVLNQSMMGDRVLTTTTNTAIVQTFAVKNRLSGQRSLLVMNRSDQFQQVRFDFKGWQPSSAVTTYTFSPSGYSEKPINASDLEHGIAIPAHSVILLYTS